MSAYLRMLHLWASGQLHAKGRVRKLSGRWFVTDAEQPGELLKGPCFRTRREAMAYADDNIEAVLERLREQHQAEIPKFGNPEILKKMPVSSCQRRSNKLDYKHTS